MDTKSESHTGKKSSDQNNSTQEVGLVKSVKDFLIYVDGLPSAKEGDLIKSEKGTVAVVTALLPTEIEAWVLSGSEVKPGDMFSPIDNKLEILVGDHLLGRAISPLGVFVDQTKAPNRAPTGEMMPLSREALGISKRQFISGQFASGITVVDLLVPLGKGQRELVVGDNRSGKTAFLLDLIVNQKNANIVCVYGLIGRSMGAVKNSVQILDSKGALSKTVIVAGFSTDPLPLIYLTPKTAMAVAEYFRSQGKDVLLILDDMGIHAKVYREISLLSGRFPGREAYPGDIFYEHASILERAGSFNKEAGGGSITAVPVIEIDLDDFSSFIPTNLMGMTDGHLLFKSSIYGQGRRPAIDVSLSVSRVGRQTQGRLQNGLSTKIKQTLAAAQQLANVTGFGGELPASTQLLLRQKEVIEQLLSQPAWMGLNFNQQVVLLALPYCKYFSDKDGTFVSQNKEKILQMINSDPEMSKIVVAIDQIKDGAELIGKLDSLQGRFEEVFEGGVKKDNVVNQETWLPTI